MPSGLEGSAGNLPSSSGPLGDNYSSLSRCQVFAHFDEAENGKEELEEGELVPDTEHAPDEKLKN